MTEFTEFWNLGVGSLLKLHIPEKSGNTQSDIINLNNLAILNKDPTPKFKMIPFTLNFVRIIIQVYPITFKDDGEHS